MNENNSVHQIAVLPGFGIGPVLSDGLLDFWAAIQASMPQDSDRDAIVFKRLEISASNWSDYLDQVAGHLTADKKQRYDAVLLGPHPANILSGLRRFFKLLIKKQEIRAFSSHSISMSPLNASTLQRTPFILYRILAPSFYEMHSAKDEMISAAVWNNEWADAQVEAAINVLRTQCELDHTIILAKHDYMLPGYHRLFKELPGVRVSNPDTGILEVLSTNDVQSIICMDLEGDLLGDLFEYLYNGTKVLGFGVNYGESSTAFYQTLHGEANNISNTDKPIPIALIRAFAAAVGQNPIHASLASRIERACQSAYDDGFAKSHSTRAWYRSIVAFFEKKGGDGETRANSC